ncbi:PadR family transcriptional regulator [Schumannella luteola]
MSSIRLFILSAFEERGPLHGHALRLVADEEHIDEWADVTPGAIYGAIKRLAAEGLIAPVRLEREGNYPERQVFEITEAGRDSLRSIRSATLATIDYRPDPFDLAMARLGPENLDGLRETLETRLAELRALLEADEIKLERIDQYLTLTERHVVRHDLHRFRGEIAWHEELLEALPAILADESSRKGPLS